MRFVGNFGRAPRCRVPGARCQVPGCPGARCPGARCPVPGLIDLIELIGLIDLTVKRAYEIILKTLIGVTLCYHSIACIRACMYVCIREG